MPKYTYRVITRAVEESYMKHTSTDVYEALGNVDFTKAKLVVDAKDVYEAESIRKGITDIGMWDLESEV